MSSDVAQVSIFCSYARKDKLLLEELEVHLSMLKRQGLIRAFHDGEIVPGVNKVQAMGEWVEQASVILLLVSSDYLASDTCYEVEMRRAIERHEAQEARVIPIIIRPCDWTHAPFAGLQYLPRDGKPVAGRRNRDRVWTDVVAGVRRAIEDLSQLSVNTLRAVLPPVWNIPYPRNAFFIGREDLFSRLRTQLQEGKPAALSQPQAISGLGGVGKTQIAIEYAYRYHQEYDVVLWAVASNQETLISSYNTVASLLRLPERDGSEQEIITEAVKRWLQTHGRWLLILDNADDLDLLPAYLPPAPGGHVLITTRAWDMQRLAQRIEVEILPDEVGALFLLRRAALMVPNAELSQASIEDRELATQITQELGGLPLALDQIGAYLEATGMSLSQYQQVYQQRQQEIWRKRRARVPDHPEPVVTTWLISFEKVEQQNPMAADLLRFCAFLAPDAIPEEVLSKGVKELGEVLAPVAADSFLLSEAIESLRAYSLMSRDAQTRALAIHRLVQAVIRNSMPIETQWQWMQRAVHAVLAAYPENPDVANWPLLDRLLPHAVLCATWIEQASLNTPSATLLLNQTGYYLQERARYAEAESLYQQALSIKEQQLGANHPDTATSLNNLAGLYYRQGKYTQAEPLYQRAIAIDEQQLGANHPDTAASLNGLAELYRVQGRNLEAEPLLVRALTIREQQLADHPDTAQSLNNLALLYKAQGKYTQAEPLFVRALSIKERQLGADHPSTANSLNSLAALYHDQGKYAQAEPLFVRACDIRERQLGADHPDTANSLNNLAMLYEDQEKYAEAESLYHRTLEICERVLGADHPYTATSLNNLAGLYYQQGKYTQAEPLYQRAIAIDEQQLGANHPDTAGSLSNLAALYYVQGKYTQAEPLFVRALAIREQQLGSDHPSTANSLNNLAKLYQTQRKYAKAEPLYRRAFEICERVLGAGHPYTQVARENYATLLRQLQTDEPSA